MFERYTEKARRAVFFARYEADQYGSPYIESEHLLLGLLRDDRKPMLRLLRGGPEYPQEIRTQIESRTLKGEKTRQLDVPLSNECKRILAYAA
jgi:ATP-dependent Clp protease ATP-binding subunit ClpC